MEEQKKELNLVEILKDCPKGTKLYSTVYGEVKLEKVEDLEDSTYPIYFYYGNNLQCATKNGLHLVQYTGECTLFPSKDNRDWSTFRIPFKDGDFIYSESENKNIWISIFKEYLDDGQKTYADLSVNSSVIFTNSDVPFCKSIDDEVKYQRLATDKEKQQLLEALHSKGYNWNNEAKKIEEIEEEKPKFDPSTLQPFDKVLVRDYSEESEWHTNFFEQIVDCEDEFRYQCLLTNWQCCIPYNDETKHLLGTNKEAPEYYRL